MYFRISPVLVFFVCSLLSGMSFAQNKVVVVTLIDEVKCKCKGTLSPQGRWCDQKNGTVMDMTNCLVWLKKADWGGTKPWQECSTYDDAHTRVALLKAGTDEAGLSDGSDAGDWRLPTIAELDNLTSGTEAVRTSAPRFFTGVFQAVYWSSTVVEFDINFAWNSYLWNGDKNYNHKSVSTYVWPVRSAN